MRLIDADALPRYTGYALSAAEVAKAVENAPTIEAEPVRYERWIKMSDADGIFYACSECGEWHKETSNYCPNCGARMEEQE